MVSGYALAFGLFLIPAGRLGDASGRLSVNTVSGGVTLLGRTPGDPASGMEK